MHLSFTLSCHVLLPFVSSFYARLNSSLRNTTQLSLHRKDLSPRAFPNAPLQQGTRYFVKVLGRGSTRWQWGKDPPRAAAKQQSPVLVPPVPPRRGGPHWRHRAKRSAPGAAALLHAAPTAVWRRPLTATKPAVGGTFPNVPEEFEITRFPPGHKKAATVMHIRTLLPFFKCIFFVVKGRRADSKGQQRVGWREPWNNSCGSGRLYEICIQLSN